MSPAGRHATVPPRARQRAVLVAVGGAVLVALRVLARWCARLTVAVWRQLGTAGRLIVVAGFSWPATELAQGADVLPVGWIVTSLVSAALIAVILGGWAAVNALGRWRWRRSGGRAWNKREPAAEVDGHYSERLDEVERRVYEILSLMANEVAAAQGAKAGRHLSVVRKELHHEAS